MEKVTFIATVFNERANIRKFMNSLLGQSKLPYEVIIVDANSNDGTYEFLVGLKDVFKKKSIFYSVMHKKCNRAKGRNIAIRKASHNIIAASDAGCILDMHWLENLVAPFSDETVAMVAGYYKPQKGTVFQNCLATYTCVMPDKLTYDFLPSSRSIAFRKFAWKQVGGYPEELDTCEDLVFAKRVKDAGMYIELAQQAIAIWPQKKTLREAASQFFAYAKGDGQAFYIRPITPWLFGRYVVAFVLFVFFPSQYPLLLLLFIFYLFWTIKKNYHYVRHWKALIFLPLLQLAADLAVMTGMSLGLVTGIVKSRTVKMNQS